MIDFLPYGRQCIDRRDIEAVVEVLEGDWLTTGPKVEAFERRLAELTGARRAVACSSGTAALHIAYGSLGIEPGDEVVVPSMTFTATASAALLQGGDVRLADVDADTGLLTPDTLLAAAEREPGPSKIKVVTLVHLNGQLADSAAIAELCRSRGWRLLEDACHAIGGTEPASAAGAPIGSCAHGDAAIFSFHPAKTVTMGEGGAMTTNDLDLADAAMRLRNHGITRTPLTFTENEIAFDDDGGANPWHYEVTVPAPNYRASDIHCALGLAQLERLGEFVDRRAHLVREYERRLEPLAPLVQRVTRTGIGRPAWHLMAVLVDFETLGLSRARLMAGLREKGIGSQVHYIPLHRQPAFLTRYGRLELPGAESYFARVLSLPLFPSMSDADVPRVVNALAEVAGLSNKE